jgi:hypothetical protein
MRLACWFRRLAETIFAQKSAMTRRYRQHARRVRYPNTAATLRGGFCAPQAADGCRLAARAPQNRKRSAAQNSDAKFSVSFVCFVVNFTAQ